MAINYKTILQTTPDILKAHNHQSTAGKCFCSSCKKTMEDKQFFKTKRLEKYPLGYLPVCKTCATLLVDDTKPETFLSLLKELGIPYISAEWAKLLKKKQPRDPSIVGLYVRNLALNFRQYKWEDTPILMQKEAEALLAAYIAETDNELEAEKMVAASQNLQDFESTAKMQTPQTLDVNINTINSSGLSSEELGISEEQLIEYRSRWGADYSYEEFLKLEAHFEELSHSWNTVTDAITRDTIIRYCQLNLKGQQCLNQNDFESFSKVQKAANDLLKIGNLAPVQNKEKQSGIFSIAQFTAQIEEKGKIVYVDKPEDHDWIDAIIEDIKDHASRFALGEPNLSNEVQSTMEVLKNSDDKGLTTEEAIKRFEENMGFGDPNSEKKWADVSMEDFIREGIDAKEEISEEQ